MSKERECQDAAYRVIRAITNEGTHPGYHQLQLDTLRKNWPTLYYALMDLVTASH